MRHLLGSICGQGDERLRTLWVKFRPAPTGRHQAAGAAVVRRLASSGQARRGPHALDPVFEAEWPGDQIVVAGTRSLSFADRGLL